MRAWLFAWRIQPNTTSVFTPPLFIFKTTLPTRILINQEVSTNQDSSAMGVYQLVDISAMGVYHLIDKLCKWVY